MSEVRMRVLVRRLRASTLVLIALVIAGCTPSVAQPDASAYVDSTERPTATATSNVAPRLPIYFEYVAQRGDTVETIAGRFGVSTETVRKNNVSITSSTEGLAAGTVLRVPSANGLLYQVKSGETVAEIAARFEVSEASIRAFVGNGIDARDVSPGAGAIILIPNPI